MYKKILVFIFIAFLIGIVLYLNIGEKTEKFSDMTLKEIILNRDMKYNDDNIFLSSISQINEDNLKNLNNSLFNSDLKLLKIILKLKI